MGRENLSKTQCVDTRASSSIKLRPEAAPTLAQNGNDGRHFVLDEVQWLAFEQALDRPVQAKPRLQQLLSTPGVLD